jgi:hypothetical protein
MPGYFLLKPGFSSVCPAAQGEVTYAILSVDQVSVPQPEADDDWVFAGNAPANNALNDTETRVGSGRVMDVPPCSPRMPIRRRFDYVDLTIAAPAC